MRMKQLFSLLLCLMLVTAALPVSVSAAMQVELVETTYDKNEGRDKYDSYEDKGLSVSGTPANRLTSGYYSLYVARSKDTPSKWALFLTSHTNSVYRDEEICTIDSAQDNACYWQDGNLTFTKARGYAWSDCAITFKIYNPDSDVAVLGSGNVIMTSISRTNTIKRNTDFNVTFQVRDPDYTTDQVDLESIEVIGIESNDSFVPRSTGNAQHPYGLLNSVDTDSRHLSFNLTFYLRYTGTGNTFTFTVQYDLLDGGSRTLQCTTSIPRTEEYVDDKDDDDDDDKTELDPLTPYIIVDSYDYGGSSVTAGEDFTLTLRLRNTSTTNALLNIVMNVSPTGVFSMTSSSNTFFIERLSAGSIMEKKVTIKPGLTKVTDDEDANAINLSFKYQYVNNANDNERLVSGESSESITLPIDFPDRFEMGIPQVDEAYQGEECYISVSLVNKGRSGVYNLTARVEGEGMDNPGQSQYIGNLNAGTESTADFSVRYNEPGDFIGNIIVTYEDANMNPKEASAPFNISVMAMDFGGGDILPPEELPPTEPVDTEPEKDPIRPVMYTVGAIVCLMSAYVTVQKAKLKRSLFSDDDI